MDLMTEADRKALDELRSVLAYMSPERLLAACKDGDPDALDVVSNGLVALRKSLGLTVAEMLGRDLAHELGLAAPVEH